MEENEKPSQEKVPPPVWTKAEAEKLAEAFAKALNEGVMKGVMTS